MADLKQKLRITIDSQKTGTGLDDVKTKGNSALGKSPTGLAGLGKAAKVALAGLALGGIALVASKLGDVVTAGMDFEKQMSRVAALSGGSAEQVAALNDQARDLGGSTAFSAMSVAGGMEKLATAGFDVNAILAAMPGLLDLSSAAGSGLEKSADIVSNILSAFGLDASDTGTVADTLAAAFTTSNTTLETLGATIEYAGPIAATLGVDLSTVAAAAAKLGDAGIKGEQGGTALRGILSRLAAPAGEAAKKLDLLNIELSDADGNLLDLPQLLENLQEGMEDLNPNEQITLMKELVGEEAMGALSILLRAGPKEIDAYRDSLRDSYGVAADIAKEQTDNLRGSFTNLDSAWEGLMITISDKLNPVLRTVADEGLLPVVRAVDSMIKPGGYGSFVDLNEYLAKFGGTAAALEPHLRGAEDDVDALKEAMFVLQYTTSGRGSAEEALVAFGNRGSWLKPKLAIGQEGVDLLTKADEDLFGSIKDTDGVVVAFGDFGTKAGVMRVRLKTSTESVGDLEGAIEGVTLMIGGANTGLISGFNAVGAKSVILREELSEDDKALVELADTINDETNVAIDALVEKTGDALGEWIDYRDSLPDGTESLEALEKQVDANVVSFGALGEVRLDITEIMPTAEQTRAATEFTADELSVSLADRFKLSFVEGGAANVIMAEALRGVFAGDSMKDIFSNAGGSLGSHFGYKIAGPMGAVIGEKVGEIAGSAAGDIAGAVGTALAPFLGLGEEEGPVAERIVKQSGQVVTTFTGGAAAGSVIKTGKPGAEVETDEVETDEGEDEPEQFGSYPRIYAAEGFAGIVTKPTAFLTGEDGPEHVEVTPLGGMAAGATAGESAAAVIGGSIGAAIAGPPGAVAGAKIGDIAGSAVSAIGGALGGIFGGDDEPAATAVTTEAGQTIATLAGGSGPGRLQVTPLSGMAAGATTGESAGLVSAVLGEEFGKRAGELAAAVGKVAVGFAKTLAGAGGAEEEAPIAPEVEPFELAYGGKSVIAAADGFSGTVSGAQAFIAGEAGPERVEITPAGETGFTGTAGPNIFITNHIQTWDPRDMKRYVQEEMGPELLRYVTEYGRRGGEVMDDSAVRRVAAA